MPIYVRFKIKVLLMRIKILHVIIAKIKIQLNVLNTYSAILAKLKYLATVSNSNSIIQFFVCVVKTHNLCVH